MRIKRTMMMMSVLISLCEIVVCMCVSVCKKYMWSSRAKLVVLVQVLRFVHNILLYYHFRNVLDFARKAHKLDFFDHKIKRKFVETYKGYFRQ